MENNEQNVNMTKKGAGFLIIIVALLVVIFGLGGYILYDKVLSDGSKDDIEEKEKKEEKEVLLNDNAVKEQLSKSISILEGTELYADEGTSGYYFHGDIYKKGIKASDMSYAQKLHSVLKSVYNNNEYFISDSSELPTRSANGEKVDNLYKSVFGETTKHDDTVVGTCPKFNYDNGDKKYHAQGACGGTSQCGMVTYNNKYTVKGDNYYVYTNVGASCAVMDGSAQTGRKIYTDYEHTKAYEGEIEDNGKFITEKNHDKFSEYKYTFIKTKDGDYKFVSVEKVK